MTDEERLIERIEEAAAVGRAALDMIEERRPEAVALRDELLRQTERLNHALADAERALVEQFPDRVAALELPLEPTRARARHGTERIALFFGTWGTRRGLFAMNGGRCDLIPLLNASREIRSAAARILPDLWENLRYDDED